MALNEFLTGLTTFFKIMDLFYLVLTALVVIYVICFRLRFNLDHSGYIILLTQLAVFTLRFIGDRLDVTQPLTLWFQPAVVYGGYIFNEVVLSFFVFEMKNVQLRI